MVLAITKILSTLRKNILAARLASILKTILCQCQKILVISRLKAMIHRTFGATVSVSKMILSM